MPYEPIDSPNGLKGFVNNAPANGNGAGSPNGQGVFPGALTDFGVEADFYSKAFSWEPKYQNRFIMSIGADLIPAFLIKASAKPSADNGEITLDHINVQRYMKGKTVWQPIQITVYDAIIPSAAQKAMEWFRLHHESATGRDGYSSMYKQDVTLQQLSGLGEIIEEWTLKGAFLKDVNFGSLNWETAEAVEIEATLRYDWAFLRY
jgi:hypothetical protein